MRFARALLTTAVLVASAACSHLETVSPQGVDLSGTWQLDRSRSDTPPPMPRSYGDEPLDERMHAGMGGAGPPQFRGPPPPMPMMTATRMTISQDRDSMGIDYPKQPYRDVKWGRQKRSLYVVDAGWDHDRLIIETQSRPMTIRETYSVSPDGATLTLLIETRAKHGDRRVTRVFTRAAADSAQPRN